MEDDIIDPIMENEIICQYKLTESELNEGLSNGLLTQCTTHKFRNKKFRKFSRQEIMNFIKEMHPEQDTEIEIKQYKKQIKQLDKEIKHLTREIQARHAQKVFIQQKVDQILELNDKKNNKKRDHKKKKRKHKHKKSKHRHRDNNDNQHINTAQHNPKDNGDNNENNDHQYINTETDTTVTAESIITESVASTQSVAAESIITESTSDTVDTHPPNINNNNLINPFSNEYSAKNMLANILNGLQANGQLSHNNDNNNNMTHNNMVNPNNLNRIILYDDNTTSNTNSNSLKRKPIDDGNEFDSSQQQPIHKKRKLS